MASEQVQRVLDRLDGVHQNTPTQWGARCPCRSDDENPSLSIGEGDSGELLMTCHYGDPCEFTEICSALGLEGSQVSVRKKELNATKAPKKKRKLTKVYPYEDEKGNLLYEKLRYTTDDGAKSFSHRRIDPDNPAEYIWSASGVRKVLYRLPQVIDAIVNSQTVWLVEGEKDVDTLVSKGLCATTMSSGAGHWEQEFTDILAGAEFVEIIADNDEPGKKHALSVRELLLAAGGSCRVRVSTYGKDITDHISSGHKASELVEIDYELPDGQAAEILEAQDKNDVEGELLESIKEVLGRDGLNISQKLNRLSMVINTFDSQETEDVGRLVNWQDFLREADNDTYEWVIPGLLEKSERVIVVAAEGVGKRATIDSVIPTPSGWTTLGEISIGDKVFDRFGNPVSVTYVSPIEPNPDAYRVTFSDGNFIDADAEHQWYTETLNEREKRKVGKVRATAEIRDTLISNRQTKALNHAIPTTKPLNLPEARLPIDPYTLGAWLGDGTTLGGSICSEDEQILENIRADGYVVRHRPSTPNMYGILGLQVQLKEHGLLGNKHIPAIYSRASYKQRLAIVQGLMDTDGTVGKKGLCEFSVNLKVLAEGFLDLLLTLGIKAKMHEGASKLYGRVTGTRYRISFKTDIPVFRLDRKLERLPKTLATPRSLYRYITKVEKIKPTPMLCISVDGPDNTYLIGDAYIPTHNTMLARQVAICAAAGIHPFTFQPMPPVRTLTIDLENPERIIRRASRSIMEHAVRKSGAKEVDARLYIRPQGIDICNDKDRMVIEQLVESVKPQLICMGPLYKSYLDNGTKSSEALAIEVARFLDRIRDVYGCALWLEHHAPLGSTMTTRDLRPFGSSVWSRWPEFGISITPDPTAIEGYVYDVRHFRGARDKRAWPVKMKRSLTLPFEVIEFMKMD